MVRHFESESRVPASKAPAMVNYVGYSMYFTVSASQARPELEFMRVNCIDR